MSNDETRRYADDVDLDAMVPEAPRQYRDHSEDYPEEAPAPVRTRVEVGERPSRIPENAPRPQDRKPKASAAPEPEFQASEPVMNEALGIMTVICHHDGMELELPSDPEDWPILATRAFENGKIISAVENILSTEDFNKVLGKKYRNKDFGKLYEKLAQAGGFESSGN